MLYKLAKSPKFFLVNNNMVNKIQFMYDYFKKHEPGLWGLLAVTSGLHYIFRRISKMASLSLSKDIRMDLRQLRILIWKSQIENSLFS